MPVLRVVPLGRIRPHEETDPLRVARLADRIAREGSQMNPMVCTQGPAEDLVLLDGATRTAALQQLGLEHAIVQIVERAKVVLETWHHVLREEKAETVLEAIRALEDVRISGDEGTPRVWTPDGGCHTIHGAGVSPNGALSSLVASYVGRIRVNRVIEPETDSMNDRFPDWAALVEFPALTLSDVTTAAIHQDLLPAGITRFVVPDRALRLNYDLSELSSPGSVEAKQAALDALIEHRSREGRVRRYEEPVVILDD